MSPYCSYASRFSSPRAIATTRIPALRAYCSARCPSPPILSTATRSPARAPLVRSALNVVSPAHSSGAASADPNPSGMAANAVARAIATSVQPPSSETPVIGCWVQCTKLAGTTDMPLVAVATEKADPDPLPDLPALHPIADGVNAPDKLVAVDPR